MWMRVWLPGGVREHASVRHELVESVAAAHTVDEGVNSLILATDSGHSFRPVPISDFVDDRMEDD